MQLGGTTDVIVHDKEPSLSLYFWSRLFGSGATTPFDSNIGAAQHTCLQIQLSQNNSLQDFGAFLLRMEGYLFVELCLTMFWLESMVEVIESYCHPCSYWVQ